MDVTEFSTKSLLMCFCRTVRRVWVPKERMLTILRSERVHSRVQVHFPRARVPESCRPDWSLYPGQSENLHISLTQFNLVCNAKRRNIVWGITPSLLWGRWSELASLSLWIQSQPTNYLKIQSLPQRKHNESLLQGVTGWWRLFRETH
jgi:hypothetical protein